MSSGQEQRARSLIAIDGRQYPRKSPMYIDVLGLSSVSEAVHEASRMLRVGIMQAMANGIDDDVSTTEKPDRQKSQSDTSRKLSQPAEKDTASVYSSVTKRKRRPIPGATDASLQEAHTQQLDDVSATTPRTGFAPRSWNATKKAGPSILSKRNRPNTVSGNTSNGGGTSSVFQPVPKREKLSDSSAKESKHSIVLESVESKKVLGRGIVKGEGRQLSSSTATKAEDSVSRTGGKIVDKSLSSVNSSIQSTSKGLKSSQTMPKKVQVAATAKDNAQSQNEVAKGQRASPSPSTRKVGLPASWCQVRAKRFKSDGMTQSAPALSQLRKSGQAKEDAISASSRGSTALPAITAMRRAGKASLLAPKSGKGVIENGGLIPLPSSTGTKVKYVPGSEIIDGVRPNGYTVSIEGVVKPVVTFNPKPKLPHQVRQNSVEKLFEAWRDNRKIAEGDALARALRAEQEMYARSASRADYRAAVTVKLKEIRKVEN